jgi:hypothetical protein
LFRFAEAGAAMLSLPDKRKTERNVFV